MCEETGTYQITLFSEEKCATRDCTTSEGERQIDGRTTVLSGLGRDTGRAQTIGDNRSLCLARVGGVCWHFLSLSPLRINAAEAVMNLLNRCRRLNWLPVCLTLLVSVAVHPAQAAVAVDGSAVLEVSIDSVGASGLVFAGEVIPPFDDFFADGGSTGFAEAFADVNAADAMNMMIGDSILLDTSFLGNATAPDSFFDAAAESIGQFEVTNPTGASIDVSFLIDFDIAADAFSSDPVIGFGVADVSLAFLEDGDPVFERSFLSDTDLGGGTFADSGTMTFMTTINSNETVAFELESFAAGVGDVSAVPEPSLALPAALGTCLLWLRRRREAGFRIDRRCWS